MATKSEILRWKLWLIKERIILSYGYRTGLIECYGKDFVENLRKVYYGPFPISFRILDVEGCRGKCYDRALLATFGFLDDEFKMIDADVDGITYSIKNIDTLRKHYGYLPIHYGNHSFIERTLKNGTVLVYDTTDGLVYDKRLYYLLNRPKITKINKKEEVLNYIEHREIVENRKKRTIEEDKYLLPSMLPIFIEKVKRGNGPYKDILLEEIELFKQEIDYEGICQERNKRMVKR